MVCTFQLLGRGRIEVLRGESREFRQTYFATYASGRWGMWLRMAAAQHWASLPFVADATLAGRVVSAAVCPHNYARYAAAGCKADREIVRGLGASEAGRP